MLPALRFVVTLPATLLALSGPLTAGPCLELLLLRSGVTLSARDLERIALGRAVSRVLETADQREIALLGVVRIDTPYELLLAQLSRPQSHLKPEYLIRWGTFGADPHAEDLRTYELPRGDRDALARCDRGDCDVKLPLDMIRRFQRFDWTAPSADDEAVRTAREWLGGYASRYMARGNDALVVYDDRQATEPLALGFRRIVDTSPLLHDGLADFREHLLRFPYDSLGRTTDALFWSVEDFGLRPLTSIVHTAVHRLEGGTPSAVVALKSIYASHYLYAALRVAALVEGRSEAGGRITYVVYSEQFLFDNNVPALVRPVVKRRLARHLEDQLEHWRETFRMPADGARRFAVAVSDEASPRQGPGCPARRSPNRP